MPRFTFRLQSLLTLREAALAQCQAELSGRIAIEHQLQSRHASLVARLHGDSYRARPWAGPIDVGRLQTAERCAASVRLELARLHAQLQALQPQIENLRQAVVESRRQVRTLEMLRQRHLEQFKRDQALRERKELDEAGARAASEIRHD